MKKHRQWTTLIGYWNEIPISNFNIKYIETLLEEGKNILIMIKKEDELLTPKYTSKEKFKEICKVFPKETKNGKIIISAVPDITNIVEMEF